MDDEPERAEQARVPSELEVELGMDKLTEYALMGEDAERGHREALLTILAGLTRETVAVA